MKLNASILVILIGLFSNFIYTEPDLAEMVKICVIGIALPAAICKTVWIGTGAMYPDAYTAKSEQINEIQKLKEELKRIDDKIAHETATSQNEMGESVNLRLNKQNRKEIIERLREKEVQLSISQQPIVTMERKIAFYNFFKYLTNASMSTQAPSQSVSNIE